MAKNFSKFSLKHADQINKQISKQMSKLTQDQLNDLSDKAYFNPKNAL